MREDETGAGAGDSRSTGDERSVGDSCSDGDHRTDGGVGRFDPRQTSPDLWQGAASADPSAGIAYELDVYAGLLEGLLARGYEFVGFEGAIDDGQIALRHDVDISLERAAAMARVESDLGIASTYCLLVTNPLYDLLAPDSRRHLGTILEAGHDVGLHFDPHYYWEAEPVVDDLEACVLEDRAALEQAIGFVASETASGVVDDAAGDAAAELQAIDAASMDTSVAEVAATSIHQPPEWALGATFDAFENTYEPAYFTEVEYVSDSAGKWRTERPFAAGVPDAMQLLVHPGLWGSSDRPMAAILDDHREQCHERIERYVGPFGG
ncbi:hypothetical protein GCM10028857_00540 [Salinarchaeum chitinilyticum]